MGSNASNPRRHYINAAELESDNDLKRQLFECVPRDSGYGKHIYDMSRPITVDEIHEIYHILRECAKKNTNFDT